MSKTAKLLLAIVFVAAIVVIALVVNKKDDSSSESNNSSSSTSSQTSDSPDSSVSSTTNDTQVAMTITYDGSSFSESADSITAGQTVKVVNASNKTLDFDSDPHPVHTDNTELNAGDIEPGQSKTFIIDKKGTWGYHNHLDASQHGSITVN